MSSKEADHERYMRNREKILARAKQRREENIEERRAKERERDRKKRERERAERSREDSSPGYTSIEEADIGKVFALWKAGWSYKAIAEDTGTKEDEVKRFLEENT